MSVSTVDWKLEVDGDGSTTTYTCAFPVMRVVDVKVYVDDVLQTMHRDYTITGIVVNSRNHVDAGFQVVFTEAPASGANILIRRKTPRHNSNKLYKGDKFQLPVFENNYDNLTMMFQEIGGLILDGYQSPIDENVPPTGYNPVSSGFYPAKIVSAVDGEQYIIRSVQPTSSGGWTTVSFPILDETASDINRRTDYSVGDIVLAKPFDDSVGNLAWRFVGNEDCSQVDTPYAGTYLEIERCDYTGTDEVAWVRSDEFSTGDEFMINGVCYTVLSTGTPPGPEFVVRLADTTAYADCPTCLAAQDPNAPDPPIEPTRYKKMANCADDSTDEYSIPIEYFGVPTNHDLTKIYEFEDACYYVSDEEEGSPSNPLFPVHAATAYDSCTECGCNPSVSWSCSRCDDTTMPSTYQVTFSGISICPGCVQIDGSLADAQLGFDVGYGLADLNGTFTLTEEANCLWGVTIPDFFEFKATQNRGVESNCIGTTATHRTATKGLRIILTLDVSDNWTLQVEYDNLTGGPEDNIGIFYDTQAALTSDGDTLCGSLPVFSNDSADAGDCGFTIPVHGTTALAFGGVATVVCGGS